MCACRFLPGIWQTCVLIGARSGMQSPGDKRGGVQERFVSRFTTISTLKSWPRKRSPARVHSQRVLDFENIYRTTNTQTNICYDEFGIRRTGYVLPCSTVLEETTDGFVSRDSEGGRNDTTICDSNCLRKRFNSVRTNGHRPRL